MLYKNISDQPVFILQSMHRTLIRPGDIINLNISDINHSGSTMRFFESLDKHNIVKINGWDKIEHKEIENKKEEIKEPDKIESNSKSLEIEDNEKISEIDNIEEYPEIKIEKNLLVDKKEPTKIIKE